MYKILPTSREYYDNSRFFTPLPEAVIEIERRRKDSKLRAKIEAYLNGDIPEHFTYSKPTFYLSRHIATPNYEALRFIEITKEYDMPKIIGIDPADTFTSNNELKRALGKMPVTKGTARNGDEIIENFTVIDFAKFDGCPFYSIVTNFGVTLQDFHTNLLHEIYPNTLMVRDESNWVSRHHRKDLLPQYKHMLALMCMHAIMFESYPPEETALVQNILQPAFDEINHIMGCRPLIVELIGDKLEEERNWNGYPSVLYPIIKNAIEGEMCEK